MEVAKYLNKLNFDWYYQHPVFLYDEKKRPRVWTPDFYLPELKVHIEVCGSKDFYYDYRDKIFQKNDVSVIFLHTYKKNEEWQSWFRKQIFEIEDNRHTKIMSNMKKLLLK